MASNYPVGMTRTDLAFVNGPSPYALCVCGHKEQEHGADWECAQVDFGRPCECERFVSDEEV